MIRYQSGGREWIFRADGSGEVKVGERVIGFIFETRRSIDSMEGMVKDIPFASCVRISRVRQLRTFGGASGN